MAQNIRAHDEIEKVRVEGHTDASGPEDFNMKLSQRRAEAVRDYLVDKGIAADRLEAVGYGETKPIAGNPGPEALAHSRAVLIAAAAEKMAGVMDAVAGVLFATVQATAAAVGLLAIGLGIWLRRRQDRTTPPAGNEARTV